MSRPDDEQSEASEWSEIDESVSDDSLMGFGGDFERDEVMRLGMATLDSLHFEAFENYMRDDRYRKAVKLLATCPNGVGLFEAKLRRMGGLNTFLARRDGSYRTLLHRTVAFESEPRVTEVLLRYGANVNVRDGRNLTPLHLAAKRANRERTIACLLERGAVVDARDDRGRTPLMLAARSDHKSNCEALIAAGAGVKGFDHKRGWAALHYALRQPSARCVAPLLDAGASLNGLALYIAMMRGSTWGLYQVLRRSPESRCISIAGRSENIDYMRRVHAAGGLEVYERDEGRKLVSLLRRHVAPRAPDDVLHVIVSFWGHPGSY